MPESPFVSHASLCTLLELIERGGIPVMIAGERPLAEAVAALEER